MLHEKKVRKKKHSEENANDGDRNIFNVKNGEDFFNFMA